MQPPGHRILGAVSLRTKLVFSGLAALLAVAGCKDRKNTAGGELSRSQCRELIRIEHAFASTDTPGMAISLGVLENRKMDDCLIRGSEMAYECIQSASDLSDVHNCEEDMLDP